MPPELTENDFELLSAYLDGMLTDADRGDMEQRLTDEPALRQELAALQQTVELIRALPPLKAPRNFALTPQQVALPATADKVLAFPATERAAPPKKLPVPVPRRRAWLPLASAAAAVLVMATGFALVISVNSPNAPAAVMDGAVAAQSTQALTQTVFQNLLAGVPAQEMVAAAPTAGASEPASPVTTDADLLRNTTQEAQAQFDATPVVDAIVPQSGTLANALPPVSAPSSLPAGMGGGGSQGMGDDFDDTGITEPKTNETLVYGTVMQINPDPNAPGFIPVTITPVVPLDAVGVDGAQGESEATTTETGNAPTTSTTAVRPNSVTERLLAVLFALINQLASFMPGMQP